MKNEVQETKYMRPAGLCAHLKIAKSTLYFWLATRPDFPKPVKAGPRVTLFDVAAIEKFMALTAA